MFPRAVIQKLLHRNFLRHRTKSTLQVLQQCQHIKKCPSAKKVLIFKVQKTVTNVVPCHCIHTTTRLAAPPLVWFFVKPIAKLTSALFGRALRKRWRKLSHEEKSFYKRKYSDLPGKIFTAVCFLLVVNYIYHIEVTPETERKRYIAFTHDQFMKIVDLEYEEVMTVTSGIMIRTSDPVYQQVARVTQRIVDANADISFFKNTTWTISVLNNEDVNAFVMPNGHIFVHAGLLKMVENDDQLAVVLGHEMSHAYLNHSAEKVSYAQFLDLILIFAVAILWAVLPTDSIAVFGHWISHFFVKLLFSLPYSRKLEMEADQVGLKLIAKACYDVRESSNFWMGMKALEVLAQTGTKETNNTDDPGEKVTPPEWLSTHPNNENRVHLLNELIPEAEDLRCSKGCPALGSSDPRTLGEVILKELTNVKFDQE